MRSKWKGPFIKQKLYLKKNKIIIFRNIEIVPAFVGFCFYVYNGKSFVNITVNEKMIGHKFGEFCFTKSKLYYGSKN
jgi:small subunit ribosomal protein S19